MKTVLKLTVQTLLPNMYLSKQLIIQTIHTTQFILVLSYEYKKGKKEARKDGREGGREGGKKE